MKKNNIFAELFFVLLVCTISFVCGALLVSGVSGASVTHKKLIESGHAEYNSMTGKFQLKTNCFVK